MSVEVAFGRRYSPTVWRVVAVRVIFAVAAIGAFVAFWAFNVERSPVSTANRTVSLDHRQDPIGNSYSCASNPSDCAEQVLAYRNPD
jgi:hypothetical protein